MRSVNLSINPSLFSHEVRTPLTAILGLATRLSKQQLTSKQRTYVEGICNQGDRLLQALNEFLFKYYPETSDMDVADAEVTTSETKTSWLATQLSVLIVEDEPIIQRMHRMMLEDLGYRVDVAKNGQEALELYSTKQYVAILTDINMPGMSGIEVSAEIRRRDTHTNRIPIIALTADITDDTKKACLAAGINEVATKPINSKGLQALFQQHLDKK